MVINDTSGHLSQVKVLDFGLSIVVTEVSSKLTRHMSRTLACMAPELFKGQQASKASDLYAVGLIAYELFANRYPFDISNIGVLINNILNTEANLSGCGLSQELSAVIGRLLAKDPKDRYEVADDVIGALYSATLQPLPEIIEIRESFLQAARFVGRDDELSKLSTHLSNILVGKGSSCLIAGESGIGKSRLLEELRTVAPVHGALVIRGQAVSEGGSPYQVWRDVVRCLCLLEDITDDEAAISKTSVPDIGVVLGRDISDAPFLIHRHHSSNY
jgi:serine/threonine protein kinase